MRTQILKGLGGVSLIGALTALSVPAQAADIRCKVPFSFTVNKATLPPGEYLISTSGNGGLLVRSFRGGAVALTNRLESRKEVDPKMVFHRYGDQYILREVWMGVGVGRELPQPRLEKELKTASNGSTIDFERIEIPGL
jgi:hypothetical protein